MTAATVSRVVDGDTVEASLADGRLLTVRLIGIDAPQVGECGFSDATARLRELVEGQAVNLVSDPAETAVDQFGRAPFYVDRISDGLDAGEETLRLGWAQLVFERPFARLSRYDAAEDGAFDAEVGVWSRCDGDFHRLRAEELWERRLSVASFMHDYYRLVSRRRFARAWGMLSRAVRREIGPFRSWRAGHRRSLGVSVRSLRVRLSGGRAVVSLSLRARDRDACSGRIVRQFFRGHWVLAPRLQSWVAARVRIRKTGGGTVRLTKSECAPDGPPPPPPPNCDPSYPTVCIRPPPPDLDCDDIRYKDFTVIGRDPHGFDGEGDGRGCEA